MRTLVFFLTSIIALTVSALVCEPQSPLQEKFLKQQAWDEVVWTIPTINGQNQVAGFEDSQGQAYIGEFFVRGEAKGEMAMELKSYYDQEKYLEKCRTDFKKGLLFVGARTAGSGNQFRWTIKNLPDFQENLLGQQNFKLSALKLVLEVAPDSIIMRSTPNPETVRSEMEGRLAKDLHLTLQEAPGRNLALNLDGYDDLACDVIMGRATVRVGVEWQHDSPLVREVMVVDPADVQTLHQKLSQQLLLNHQVANHQFIAGAIWQEMLLNGEIKLGDLSRAARLAPMFFDKFDRLQELNARDYQCLAGQFNSYSEHQTFSTQSLTMNRPTVSEE